MKEKEEKTRKAGEANAKAEAENVEMARTWAEAKAKEISDIARINVKARKLEMAEAEAIVREKSNSVQKAAVEARQGKGKNSNTASIVAVKAAAKIRASAKIQGTKRERSEAEERAKAEADIWEKE